MNGITKLQTVNGSLQFSFDATVQPEDVNKYCMQKGITLSHLLLKKKSLETKFMELTNEAQS